jgi:MoaA/NifB/PqqE/SkfB family radical SAM enzyme
MIYQLVKVLYLQSRRILPWNMVNHIGMVGQQALGLIKYGDLHFPRSMAIEITTHCNRRCFYCPQSVDPTNAREIKMEVFRKWIGRLKELGWKGTIYFNLYNEPLLCKNLEEYARIVKNELPDSMLTIATNGDLLTEETALSLFEAGVFKFTVVHHPPLKDDWTKRLNALKEKFPSRIYIGIIEHNRLSNRGGLVAENLRRYNRESDAGYISKVGCFTNSCSFNTTIDGDYLWCFCDYYKNNTHGNVFTMSILDAWNYKDWKSLREKIRHAVPVLEVCKKCFCQ